MELNNSTRVQTNANASRRNEAINHDLVRSVKARIMTKEGGISHQEMAEAIASDKYLFFNFLLDNHANSVAEILKNKIGEKMDFKPSRAQLEAIISSYIEKENNGKLQTIINNFRYNPNAGNYTNYPEIHNLLIQKLPR